MQEHSRHYLCPPLLKLLRATAQKKIGIIGRGGGKSTYVGMELYQCYQELPRSLGALYGPTYTQLLTKIFPSAKKSMLAAGLREDRPGRPGHFVIGRKPPAYFRHRPYNEPEKWEYVISLWNGAATEFISMDRPDLQRGGSYDYQIFDEAALVKKTFHDRVAETSLRGNLRYFRGRHRHGMQVYVTSQAHSASGYWVEDQKYLIGDGGEILRGPGGERLLDPDVFCITGTSYDNVAILGDKTLARWKKSMPPQIFDIEVLSLRGERGPNGYYPAFSTEHHCYYAGGSYDYDEKSEFGIVTQTADTDRDPAQPLLLSMDFNASLNSLLVAQEQGRVLRFLSEFYEQGNESVSKWLTPFLDAYRHHPTRRIELYGDPGGNKVASMQQFSQFDQVAQFLRKAGWQVQIMVSGKAYPNHLQRQKYFHDVLSEASQLLPVVRIHYTRCRWLITSMEAAGINPDYTKDKRSERQQIDQRGATHPSDVFDYLIWYRYREGLRAAPPGSSDGGLRIGGTAL